jgi:hypothetical protein
MQKFNIFLPSNLVQTFSAQLCNSLTQPGRPTATSHTHNMPLTDAEGLLCLQLHTAGQRLFFS